MLLHFAFNIRLFQQRSFRAMVFMLVLHLWWLRQLVMELALLQELILLLDFIQLLQLGDFQLVIRRTFFLYKNLLKNYKFNLSQIIFNGFH